MNGTTSAIRVRTRYSDVDDFVIGYSPFFDGRGLFIRTRRLQEIGSRLRFELQLADGSSVFRGEGIVDEVREPPRSATGMHVRITKLDRESKLLFERIVTQRDSEVARRAPTPEEPHRAAGVVLGGAAAEPRAEPSPRAEVRPAATGGGELTGDLLGEIADGIEMTLDSVLVSGHVDPAGAASLGGFFGSPAELAAAGMHVAASGSFSGAFGAAAPAAHETDDQLAAFEADRAAHPDHAASGPPPGAFHPATGSAEALPDEGVYEHQSNAEAVFEHSYSDQFPPAEVLEPGGEEEDVFPLSAGAPRRPITGPVPAPPPPAFEPAPLLPAADEAPATGAEAGGLGDLALAMASNYGMTPEVGLAAVTATQEAAAEVGAAAQAPVTAEPPAEAEVLEGDLVDESEVAAGEEVVEAVAEPERRVRPLPAPVMAAAAAVAEAPAEVAEPAELDEAAAAAEPDEAAAPAEPRRVPRPVTSPSIRAVAAGGHHQAVAGEARVTKPHQFVREEAAPGLDDLLHDILEENEGPSVTSSSSLPVMSIDEEGEGEEAAGPDPLDELLARETTESDAAPKPKAGLLKRLFGRKG